VGWCGPPRRLAGSPRAARAPGGSRPARGRRGDAQRAAGARRRVELERALAQRRRHRRADARASDVQSGGMGINRIQTAASRRASPPNPAQPAPRFPRRFGVRPRSLDHAVEIQCRCHAMVLQFKRRFPQPPWTRTGALAQFPRPTACARAGWRSRAGSRSQPSN
jgi:hypothetical protein